MCLLAWLEKDKKITDEQYCYIYDGNVVYPDGNKDGVGVAYVKDGKLVVEKGFFNDDKKNTKMLSFLREREKYGDMLIHFRKASSGTPIDQDNCHPFEVDSGEFFKLENGEPRYQFAIGHNGKLPYPNTKDKSDTACFVEDVLGKQLRRDPFFLDYGAGKWLLEKSVGDSNKMLILRYDRQENKLLKYIINERGNVGDKMANWKDGIWFSNYSYEAPRKTSTTTYINGHVYGGGSTPMSQAVWDEMERESIAGLMGTTVVNQMQVSPFAVPDANGWYWSFPCDCWINKNTGACVDYLKTRPERPYYIKKRKPDALFKDQTETKEPVKTIDPDALSGEEWQAWLDKGSNNKVELEGGTKIEVPRDAEVEVINDFSHLDKQERKILNRACYDYVKRQMGKKSMKGFTNGEAVTWVHSDLRENLPGMKQMDREWIDKAIVAQARKGNSVEDMICILANTQMGV